MFSAARFRGLREFIQFFGAVVCGAQRALTILRGNACKQRIPSCYDVGDLLPLFLTGKRKHLLIHKGSRSALRFRRTGWGCRVTRR